MLRWFLSSLALLVLFATSASGVDRFVSPSGTDVSACTTSISPCKTIGYAIAAASDEDIINLAAGVYKGVNNSFLSLRNANLVIRGAGMDATVIDGQQTDRIMDISQASIVSLSDLTFKNGFSNFSHNPIKANTAGACLGIRDGSNVTIDSVRFTGCVCEVPPNAALHLISSAGIFLDVATASVSNSIFSHCMAGSAAAIGTFTANITIHNTTFQYNFVPGWGTIVPDFGSRMTMTDSRFFDNYASCCGAAIDDGGPSAWTIERTHFRNNTAFRGGSIYRYGNGPAKITDSIFEDSTALASGGILDVGSTEGLLEFERCHFLRPWALDGSLSRGTSGSKIMYRDSIVEQAISYNNVALVNANVGMENMIFRNNTKVFNSVLVIEDIQQATAKNITLEDNQSTNILEVRAREFDARAIAESITLIRNRATEAPLTIFGVGTANFVNLTCVENVGSRGGCIKASIAVQVQLINSVIRRNRASVGGAVFADSNAAIEVLDSLIADNEAFSGGAIALAAEAQLTLSGSTSLMDNSARVSGGAIYFESGYASCPKILNESVSIQGNVAANGGAAYWTLPRQACDSFEDMCFTCDLSKIANNTARINGGSVSSAPTSLRLVSDLSSTYTTSQRFDVKLSIVDYFGNPLKVSDYVAVAVAYEVIDGRSDPVFLGGVTTKDFRASASEISLDALAFVSKPGSTLQLSFFTEPATSVVNRTITIRDCGDVEYLHLQDGRYYCLRRVDIARPISIAMTIIGAFGMLCALALTIIVFLFRGESVIRKSSSSFSMVICIGSVVMFASVITFSWTSPGACGIRPWLLTLGFGLVYGSLFIKARFLSPQSMLRKDVAQSVNFPLQNWRLWKLFSSDMSVMLTITDTTLFKGLGIVISVQLLILILWFALGPLSVVGTVDIVVGTISFTCGSNVAGDALFWILFSACALLLLGGCLIAYYTRSIPTNFSESKWIALSVYNVTIASTGSIGVAAGLPNPNVIALATTLGIAFTTFVTLFTLMIPKLRFVFFMERMVRSLEKHQEKLQQDMMWIGRQLDELRNRTVRHTTTGATGVSLENSSKANVDLSWKEKSRSGVSAGESTKSESSA